MGQNCTFHHDGDLLYDTNTGMTGLPRLLAAADSLEEGQKRRNAERGGYDRERTGCGVSHILISMVDM
jgi:hypothetical protein